MPRGTWSVAPIALAVLVVSLAPAHAENAGAASDSTSVKSVASTNAHQGEPRTLEDINIEGKIAVPQVLFITARDPRRFMGFQHRRYLKTSTTIGDETPYPSWIVRLAQPTTPATKETSP